MREQIINYEVDKDFTLDGTPTMERIRHKKKLLQDTNGIFSDLSKYKTVYPKGYYNRILREIKKDVYKGFKVINKKNPVFIEMPKLESVGNGMVKEKYDGKNDEEEITVNLPITIPHSTDLTT